MTLPRKLEIRVSNEALLTKGHEAHLCVSGATAASIPEGDTVDSIGVPEKTVLVA